MKTLIAIAATLAAVVPSLSAQDEQPVAGAELAIPDPKVAEHAALAAFVGTWETVGKMEAMPGVPGMEKPITSTGIERAELICNGLWLKSTMTGVFGEEVCEGIWLVGYDPHAKGYVGIWTSSMDEPATFFTGEYDAKARTWTFLGETAQGPMRSTLVHRDDDTSVETCYTKGADGKDLKCAEITRTRKKSPVAIAASAGGVAAPGPELARLHAGLGRWNAAVTCEMPGIGRTESKCVEIVSAICNGRWTWSDFTGEMGGVPFEGHCLCGYDAAAKEYVSIWIDSCAPTSAVCKGTLDEKTGEFTFRGDCRDPLGKPAHMHQVYSQKDANTRHMKMSFRSEAITNDMEIVYTRAPRK